MRRRDLIILLAGAMGGWPSAARAQQKAMPVIGVLGSTSRGAPFVATFLEGLADLGRKVRPSGCTMLVGAGGGSYSTSTVCNRPATACGSI